MSMEIIHKIFNLLSYIYISLFVFKYTATDNDTVHVYKVSRTHISSAVLGMQRTLWLLTTIDLIFLEVFFLVNLSDSDNNCEVLHFWKLEHLILIRYVLWVLCKKGI